MQSSSRNESLFWRRYNLTVILKIEHTLKHFCWVKLAGFPFPTAKKLTAEIQPFWLDYWRWEWGSWLCLSQVATTSGWTFQLAVPGYIHVCLSRQSSQANVIVTFQIDFHLPTKILSSKMEIKQIVTSYMGKVYRKTVGSVYSSKLQRHLLTYRQSIHFVLTIEHSESFLLPLPLWNKAASYSYWWWRIWSLDYFLLQYLVGSNAYICLAMEHFRSRRWSTIPALWSINLRNSALTAKTKHTLLHGLCSLLMEPVWLFISFC